VVSTAAALVLLPLLAVIVACIWCTSGPPALFKQDRWGLDGRIFVIWKFRTMRPPAYPGEPDSARLLPLGALLRRTSLDELPQLWNIIRGEMSLVGPRPLPVHVGEEVVYSPRQWGRLSVRPGLTGWAQVNGRNSLTWPEKIEQDLWYIAHRSVLLDLRIVARTVLQVIRPRGIDGYGVENPGFSEQPSATARSAGPDAPVVTQGAPAQLRANSGTRRESSVPRPNAEQRSVALGAPIDRRFLINDQAKEVGR